MRFFRRCGKEPRNVIKVSYTKLASYTNNFSESNYIGRFQFGKLYRGVLSSPPWVTYILVKIWEVPEIYSYEPGDNEIRLMEEVVLLRNVPLISHPGMVPLYGYCHEGGHLAAVYEFKPFDSVVNLIPKDDFTWLQRIKVSLGLAALLKFMHAGNSSSFKPFIVHNLDAAHIILDEDYNPKLCDFGSVSGGIFNEGRDHGYTNVGTSGTGNCSNKEDVFAYGVILLSLISRRVHTEEDRKAGVPFIYEWAVNEYEAFECQNTKFSLVHKSLSEGGDFSHSDGYKITKLALECINGVEHERPTMEQVFRSLLELEVAKQHADFLGANDTREDGC
ncbi:hypothetical protein ABFS82_13G032300 [Erythranthe guttata]|uniref:protein kinase 2A, chloroplastic-like n=1 Tax=Erythranthe guttata TaxID=4155 RepID=UPI00064D7ED2|nr:PREDICTED: protein kinase 2A, chloroplastic-like [Erythranthe guttata]|eukprot:XP_012831712.1 PREDICTED: protein kinase 2A, chloroplastic-like [Erythranthe guttata]